MVDLNPVSHVAISLKWERQSLDIVTDDVILGDGLADTEKFEDVCEHYFTSSEMKFITNQDKYFLSQD